MAIDGANWAMRIWAVFFILVMSNSAAQAAEPVITCRGQQFIFEDGLLGGKVSVLRGEERLDFCKSSDPETSRQELVFRGDEVWCLTYHHITADSRPYARSSWLLNRQLGTLQTNEYLWVNGTWVRQTLERTRCHFEAE